MQMILLQTVFKTFRLIVIIFMVSYFLGLIFYIFADLTNENAKDENFIEHFQINDMNCNQRAIAMIYYAFTSLSTVGFGDYNPRSNIERLFVALMLLFGVAIFSYIMGNFIEILEQLNMLNASFDESDQLSKFFGLIRNYNGGKKMNAELQEDIEEFF